MFEIVRYEATRRRRGSLVMAVGLGIFAVLVVALFPSIEASGVDFQAYAESLPPAFRNAFGVTAFGTIEGFLAAEFYQFVWVLLLGLYVAYVAGGAIAGAVEDHRIELVLSGPVSRARYLLETYASLLTPILIFNVVVFAFVLASVAAIGESVSAADLAVVHLLSIPYLLACGAIGLVLSVAVDRAALAERGAIGLVFLLFLLESVTASTEYDWLALLSPTHYYDPTAVLVENVADWTGSLVLLGASVVLLAIAVAVFDRRDL